MSYCRWSTDDFACDLYIYESVYDCWTIHVAGGRHVGPLPPVPSLKELCDRAVTGEEYAAASKVRRAWMDKHGTVPIDLPHAGETFDLATPGECADKVEELAALGYCVPDYVVPTLREEQAALSAHPGGRGEGE